MPRGRKTFGVMQGLLMSEEGGIRGIHTFASWACVPPPLRCLGRACRLSDGCRVLLNQLTPVSFWGVFQGPRGLPGERGRTGPAGAAVSN